MFLSQYRNILVDKSFSASSLHLYCRKKRFEILRIRIYFRQSTYKNIGLNWVKKKTPWLVLMIRYVRSISVLHSLKLVM